MSFVVDEFCRKCREYGSTPMVMVHCGVQFDAENFDYVIEDHDHLLPFVQGLRRRGVIVLCIREILLEELDSERAELADLLTPGGNYTFLANQIIARKLELFFRLLAEGTTSEAVARYQESLQAEVDYCEAHAKAGLAYARRARGSEDVLDVALYHCQKAVSLDRRNPDAMFALGTVYHLIESYEQARECLDEALRLEPDHAEALRCLAAIESQAR
jgi:tetratricopeptide (TPR) repeat protein